MSSPRIDAFVATMKLRNLREARDRLAMAYDAIDARATGEPRAVLRALAEGLLALKVGDRRLHPEIGDLELVWTVGDPALVDRWIGRLRTIVRQGRARADVIPLFGGVVGEWARPDRRRHLPGPADRDLSGWTAPAGPAPRWQALVERVDPPTLARARALVRERTAALFDAAYVSVPYGIPDDLLTADGQEDAAALPRELGEAGPDPDWLELAAALRLAWEGIEGWDWPAGGVALEPAWTRNRFRLRPRLGWVEAALAQTVGSRMEDCLGAISGRGRLNRLLRLDRLLELSAPQIIVDNERRMLGEMVDLLGWIPDLGEPGTVQRARIAAATLTADDGYGYDGSSIGVGLAWLGAEIELARAHGRPIYVLKTDLADFYPSVSHALVRELLVWLDADPRVVELVLRVLSLRLPDGTRTTRGLPLGLSLSRAVGEWLVGMVVAEVRRSARVQVTSLVDDLVCVAANPEALAATWAALNRATEALGLRLHPDKTGALALGGSLPPEVPAGRVRWGLLRVDAGGLRLDDEALDDFVATSRARIEAHEALLDRVAAYRGQLRYLQTWLAPQAKLGADHFGVVEEALRRFEDGVGLAGSLRSELSARFLGGAPAEVPDAWLHWPITAGGLAVPYPAADLVPLRLAARRAEADGGATDRGAAGRTPAPVPASDPPEAEAAWAAWFADRLEPWKPVPPAHAEGMDARVAGFVQRGEKLGREGKELSPYWSWVLHTLGPDVLDTYGTFDFLPTDLVPVSLIRRAGRTTEP